MSSRLLRSFSLVLAVLAYGPTPGSPSGTPVNAQGPVAGCPAGQVAGCNKGIWVLNSSGAAVITDLDEEATYRICLGSTARNPVVVVLEGIALQGPTSQELLIVPPGNVEEALNRRCALATGRRIHLRSPNILDPLPSYGEYERLEAVNSLSQLHAFGAPLSSTAEVGILIAAVTARRLMRICIGPIEQRGGIGVGRRYLMVDGGFVLGRSDNLRGFPFPHSSCVDVSAGRVALFATRGDNSEPERLNGFVAY